jgi:DNA repair/transcription protein MET18/MMS19
LLLNLFPGFIYLLILLVGQDSSTSTHRNIIALLTAAVVPLYKEVELSLGDDDLGRFLDGLIGWVLDNKADNEPTKLSALYMLSSIVNRRSSGKFIRRSPNVHVID